MACPCPRRRFATSICGPVELLVACRVQAGAGSSMRPGSPTSLSARPWTRSAVRAGNPTLDASRSSGTRFAPSGTEPLARVPNDAEAEREALVDQLAAAYGLGGRMRRGSDPIERARSTVTKQIHGAIARIAQAHPSLALHLTNSLRTGRYCTLSLPRPPPTAGADAAHYAHHPDGSRPDQT